MQNTPYNGIWKETELEGGRVHIHSNVLYIEATYACREDAVKAIAERALTLRDSLSSVITALRPDLLNAEESEVPEKKEVPEKPVKRQPRKGKRTNASS